MPNKTTKGLGRGFDSLLPQDFDSSILVDENERIQKVAVTDITPNIHQPRQHFDKDAIAELADSIKRHGILQPLVITSLEKPGSYMLIAGERRWRAAKLADLSHVPAIVRSAKEIERLEIALIENVQREDLSPLEQAVSIQRLHDQFNVEYDDIAKRLGKAKTTIINIARLLGLSDEARQALVQKKISEGHARSVLAMGSHDRQNELLKLILANGWSVRQAERYAAASKQTDASSQKAKEQVKSVTPETVKISQKLGVPVTLRRMAKGGKIEISFADEVELKRLVTKIAGRS